MNTVLSISFMLLFCVSVLARNLLLETQDKEGKKFLFKTNMTIAYQKFVDTVGQNKISQRIQTNI